MLVAKVVVSARTASRFSKVDKNDIQNLKVSSENENTRKNTNYWLNIFQKWATAREVKQRLEEYECQVLNKTLCKEELCTGCHKRVILVKFSITFTFVFNFFQI